ncbi:MAG: hypothetical protein JJU37_13500 [Balneolaceae bacterium]|nr:hypothetical protein [Balneolaceae bacterium]
MNLNQLHLFITAVLLTSILFLGACDNSFDPTDRDNGIYSVHGMLDLLEETSYIRVRDMNAPFTLDATEELDAIVTLYNLDSGDSFQLNSDIREFEGVFLHTFTFSDGVVPDTPYQIRVENSIGLELELTTQTPTLPELQINRENDACSTPVNLVFAPLNGGTMVLRFGLEEDQEDRDGRWGILRVYDSSRYTDQVSLSITPHRTAEGIANAWGAPCSSLLRDGYLYLAIAHYSPGFYERLNDEVTDILLTTQQFGGFYADTLAIPIDTSQ